MRRMWKRREDGLGYSVFSQRAGWVLFRLHPDEQAAGPRVRLRQAKQRGRRRRGRQASRRSPPLMLVAPVHGPTYHVFVLVSCCTSLGERTGRSACGSRDAHGAGRPSTDDHRSTLYFRRSCKQSRCRVVPGPAHTNRQESAGARTPTEAGMRRGDAGGFAALEKMG